MLELINPFDPDEFKKNFLTVEPFPHFCIDNFLNEGFANEIYDSFPTFQEAKALGQGFKAVNESKKIQISDDSKFAPAMKKLSDLLQSKKFVDMWSDLTGLPNLLSDPKLIGGGIHETNSGGHLDVHVDFNFVEKEQLHRRLNILIYFNKDWKEEYGGYLDLWDVNVKKRYGYFKPKFNRACGFITSGTSYHGVTPLTCPPDIFRKSFAAYYYTKEAPEGWTGKKHSTLFKARPNQWIRGNIEMSIENAMRSFQNTIKNTKQTIKKLWNK